MGRPRRLVAPLSLGAVLVWAACDDPTGPPLCVTILNYTIGETVSGSLAPGDCELLVDRSFIDFYRLTAPTQLGVEFNLSSGSFDTFLHLFQGAGVDAPVVAGNNDENEFSTNSAIRILLAAGTYVVGANSRTGGETGSYVLSSATVPEAVDNCPEVWATLGIATAQTIEETDCVDETGPFYSDEFLVLLGKGESITVTMTSTAVDSYLILINSQVDVVAEDDDSAGGLDARIVYTAPTGPTAPDVDRYIIVATTFDANETGAYALSIN